MLWSESQVIQPDLAPSSPLASIVRRQWSLEERAAWYRAGPCRPGDSNLELEAQHESTNDEWLEPSWASEPYVKLWRSRDS